MNNGPQIGSPSTLPQPGQPSMFFWADRHLRQNQGETDTQVIAAPV